MTQDQKTQDKISEAGFKTNPVPWHLCKEVKPGIHEVRMLLSDGMVEALWHGLPVQKVSLKVIDNKELTFMFHRTLGDRFRIWRNRRRAAR